MNIQADLLVRDAMVQAFQAVNTNPNLLQSDVFPQRPIDEQQTIQEYFLATPPRIALGFPTQSGEVPGVFISLQQAPEDMQFISSAVDDVYGEPNDESVTEVQGTFMRPTVRVSCWAVQHDATMYIQNVALWGLLRYRTALEEEGLQEQRFTVTDFEPVPDWWPDLAFRREILHSSVHLVAAQQSFLRIREVTAIAHPTVYAGTARASIRDQRRRQP